MAVEITFGMDQPKDLVRTTGVYPGMFNDDLKFTFEAKDFHTTDPTEVAKVFAELDLAVREVKKAWDRSRKT
jgi:hypothetical protein